MQCGVEKQMAFVGMGEMIRWRGLSLRALSLSLQEIILNIFCTFHGEDFSS
jgi:hypothetical protein